MRLRRSPITTPASGRAPTRPSLADLAEKLAASRDADAIADAVVGGLADALGSQRSTLLKTSPELLMPLGHADKGPLLDAELQIAGAVMRSGEPRFLTQTAHPLPARDDEPPTEVEVSTLALPLLSAGELVGVLVATWLGPREPLSDEERETARLIASVTALAMDRAFLGERARLLNERDPLTGTGSRDSLITLLEMLRERGTVHALVLLDVDDFGAYATRLGGEAGDQLLTALATMISRECRDGDALVRSGGDEFALVLMGSSAAAGAAAARRVVDAIADWGHEDHVTVSAGVAACSSEQSPDVLDAASAALREAKGAGRGRIGVA